jgi:polysaccharide export outer membrane protein
MKLKIGIQSLILSLLLVFSISCVPLKEISYFNDINELEEPIPNPRQQKPIMPFDKLYIKVLSIDEKTNQLFNSADDSRSGSASNTIGYYVDENGNINFPFAGNINVGGLTTVQAGIKIQEALSEYVSKAAITVKYIDNSVTVIGAVQKQGIFSFNQDKINIYEALALGGGLTQYGNRKNIILIRREGDRIMHHKLNLTDSKISGKNFFYILPNDVIVVEPMRNISNSYGNNTYSTILGSITTFLAILIFAGIRF